MSAIRATNTKPELIIRRALHAQGLRYRLHDKKLPGKPDLVFPKYQAVVFVHGCFWHAHDCPMFHWPKSKTEFWREKITGNKERDVRLMDELQKLNWRRAVVWECALKGRGKRELPELIDSLTMCLSSDAETLCIEGLWSDRTA